jgi:hypothetical protein
MPFRVGPRYLQHERTGWRSCLGAVRGRAVPEGRSAEGPVASTTCLRIARAKLAQTTTSCPPVPGMLTLLRQLTRAICGRADCVSIRRMRTGSDLPVRPLRARCPSCRQRGQVGQVTQKMRD